jgi:hypothetical protein
MSDKENEFGELQEASPDSVAFVIHKTGNKYLLTFSERVPALEVALKGFYNTKDDSFKIGKSNFDSLTSGLTSEKKFSVSVGSRTVELPGKFKMIVPHDDDNDGEGMYYPNKGGRRRTRRVHKLRRRFAKKLTKRTK